MLESELGALIQRIKEGKTQEFQVIVTHYEKLVFKILHTRLPRFLHWAAEDLAQEIFLILYDKLDRYQIGTSFVNWLYTISVNHCIKYVKKERRRIHEPLNELLADGREEPVSEDPEVPDTLRQALFSLPDKYQKVLFFYYSENKKIQDIASILNVSENTVKTWLKRAKEKLSKQKNLQNLLETFSD